MSVLNAFLSTWSNARQTFGEGSPQTGAQYDNSSTLRQLESNRGDPPRPDRGWTGTAATNYGHGQHRTPSGDRGNSLGWTRD